MKEETGKFFSHRNCNDEHKSVEFLDQFMKSFCIDATAKEDLVFRCSECPFQTKDEICLCKDFKIKYAPDYKDFGSMGDL